MALIGGGARGVFDGCRFEENEAWGGAPSPTYAYDANVGEGGAVYARGGAASFRRCEFVGNVAEKEGGAVYVDGGGTATFEACTFARNRVHDDYWDGGAGVFLASPKTFARFDVVRFEDNVVAAYPDARRRAMTCGGGAVSVVRGASASFTFALFERNAAPRGGAVCVHDAVARYADAVFRSNRAAHPWFEHPPGDDVECVQCFEWGSTANANTNERTNADDAHAQPIAALDRCAYRRDEEARETFEGIDESTSVRARPRARSRSRKTTTTTTKRTASSTRQRRRLPWKLWASISPPRSPREACEAWEKSRRIQTSTETTTAEVSEDERRRASRGRVSREYRNGANANATCVSHGCETYE